MRSFPKEIYIRIDDEDPDSPVFLADADYEDVAEIGKEIRVGSYRLVEVLKIGTEITVNAEETPNAEA